MIGSNLPARSRGTSIITSPAAVSTVLERVPLGDVAVLGRGRLVRSVAQVVGHRLFKGRLKNRGGDRLQQPVRASDVLTRFSPGHQQP